MEFQWDDSYSVGVPQIDEQHQKLFGIMHDLSVALIKGHGNYAIQSILARLADYTHYHFHSEELLMIRFEYPGYQDHKKQHEAFREDLARLILRYREGEGLVNVDTYKALRDWLVRHVTDHTQGPDQRLGRFLRTGEYDDPHARPEDPSAIHDDDSEPSAEPADSADTTDESAPSEGDDETLV